MRSIQKQILLITILLSLLLLLTACGSANPSHARTYYESLDLATPERAITTFINAFNKTDFWTVYLILAPRAQFAWGVTINMLQYEELMNYDLWDEFKPDFFAFLQTIFDDGEQAAWDNGYFFDQFMLIIDHHDAFLIDLRGNLEILSSEESTTSDGNPCVNVTARVGNLESVVFRMVQAPSGRWRVLQVIVPDGDEEQIPWSVPAE